MQRAWAGLLSWMALACHAWARAQGDVPEPGPVPADVRSRLGLSPRHAQAAMLGNFPIVGSTNVSRPALREAAWIVQRMVAHRPRLLDAMASNKVRLVVMSWNEFTTDVPEHAGLQPKVYWDRRARGLGATPDVPAVSCGEENLLGHPGDPYATENILVHEFAHAIHETGMNALDPTFEGRLREAFRGATNRGLWKGTYAAVNHHEYWAEATQSWFDNNRSNDALHNDVDTRAELIAYDPPVAALCREVYGDGDWRYTKPAARPAAGRAHLDGWNPSTLPRFTWRPAPVGERPRVSIQTALGDIEVELDARRAPLSSSNFIRYVHEGFYSDGVVFRTVREGNQPTNEVRIAVIQGKASPAREPETFPAIPLERTRDTGLRHLDGTLSMAREGPDSATHHFFICVGDQPELDFGGRRNPDGQGFAAFGRVVKGMDLVRRIHAMEADGQSLKPPVRIQRAIRIE
jgi:cyclophilin family peptidyl-prolyl cis-trans isomerase